MRQHRARRRPHPRKRILLHRGWFRCGETQASKFLTKSTRRMHVRSYEPQSARRGEPRTPGFDGDGRVRPAVTLGYQRSILAISPVSASA